MCTFLLSHHHQGRATVRSDKVYGGMTFLLKPARIYESAHSSRLFTPSANIHLGFHARMSNNQPNRPQSRQQQAPWQCPTPTQNPPPQLSRPGVHRSNTVEITLVAEMPAAFIMSPRGAELGLVIANDRGGHIRGSQRGGGGGGGRGGRGGRGGQQRRIDEMLPVVANRIAETRGDNRQGALNARSPRDGGRGRERPSSDTEIRQRSGEGRPQRGDRGGQAGEWPPLRGQGSGRESPSQWPSDERRGSPGARDGERPSHNRLDEATLSSDPARADRAQVANETLKVLYDEVSDFLVCFRMSELSSYINAGIIRL